MSFVCYFVVFRERYKALVPFYVVRKLFSDVRCYDCAIINSCEVILQPKKYHLFATSLFLSLATQESRHK